MKISLETQSETKFKGLVQTLRCSRIGEDGEGNYVKWEKKIWVPTEDNEACMDKFNGKKVGKFLYELVGDIQVQQRRPRNIPPWDDF